MRIINHVFIKILKVVYNLFPTSIQRILWHIFFTGKKFTYRNDPNVFRKIYENNMWNSDESYSERRVLSRPVFLGGGLGKVDAKISVEY
jgi:hypothetical protein